MSQADKDRLEADGVLIMRDFFSAQDAQGMTAAWRELGDDARVTALSRTRRFVFGSLPGPIGTLYRHVSLVNLMRTLLGENVALYMNRLLLKDKTCAGAVELHQDMPYLHGGQEKISVFVPLLPALAQQGGLRYAVGTHRHGLLAPGPVDAGAYPQFVELAPDLDVGDIVLVSSLTWHWSEAAELQHERPLIQLMYQSAADGTYAGTAFGVGEPTLVSGTWQTSIFTALRSEEKRNGPGNLETA